MTIPPTKQVACIMAVNRNGTIGHEGGIPWKAKGDLARFKRIMSGNTQVIGRKTHDSLQLLHGAAVREYDKKMLQITELYAEELKTVDEESDLSEGKRQRKIAQIKHARGEAMAAVPKVSFPYSLPNRLTIVVSRTLPKGPCPTNPDLYFVNSPVEAVNAYAEIGRGHFICAGGAQLYKEFWDHASLLYITVVEDDVVGDTTFDINLCPDTWRVAATQTVWLEPDADNPQARLSHTYQTLRRRKVPLD